MKYLKVIAALVPVILAACSSVRGRNVAAMTGEDTGPPVIVYVSKRSWHTDIGFAASDLQASLATLRARLPAARFVFFGFGDRHYLLNHGGRTSGLTALWPGAGVVLVTGIANTPA